MSARLFHIFRNNPLGRETLLQSICFCEKVGASLVIYIPRHTKFLMPFETNMVQVDLDGSYLISPDTALMHANDLIEKRGLTAKFLNSDYTGAAALPEIQPKFDFMTCPRSVSDLSSKIGLGYLGPRVRRLVGSAQFPILLTSPAFKEWNSIAVFFGGSANAVKALKLGLRISRVSGLPINVFTQTENTSRESYEKVIEKNSLEKEMRRRINEWYIFEQNSFEENLYQVPHDALVVLGAYGRSRLKDMVFGRKMEKIQSTLPNNILIVGPNYKEPNSSLPAWFPSLG
ncbi:MAG: universal stress protein [Desulfobacterales bacterium]|uniref:Universal stress protein n=1 Tax=Candidatus Desulfatibia vada TaxID=2841696 RepID=A0A8J6TPW7_9BACT|nr:universal stress protein [Candidatus Desulfatibia vada]MBL6970756.1 universal stress protein [Desulfobacterales bacterium]